MKHLAFLLVVFCCFSCSFFGQVNAALELVEVIPVSGRLPPNNELIAIKNRVILFNSGSSTISITRPDSTAIDLLMDSIDLQKLYSLVPTQNILIQLELLLSSSDMNK